MKRSAFTQLLLKDFEDRKQEKKRERINAVAAIKLKSESESKLKIAPVIQQVLAANKLKHNLKVQFEYTCYKCNKPIVYDTLWLNDFTNRYIPLDKESMLPHKCLKHNSTSPSPKGYQNNIILQNVLKS
jgi:hypothetical protein